MIVTSLVRRENGKLILGEINKTSKFIEAARLQLPYNLWLRKQEGVEVIGKIRLDIERRLLELITHIRQHSIFRRNLQSLIHTQHVIFNQTIR
jgi:hypothetical protein